MLVQGAGIGYRALATDNVNFQRFFQSAFDPITLSSVAQQEINNINSLIAL
jgi:hypothetical protein